MGIGGIIGYTVKRSFDDDFSLTKTSKTKSKTKSSLRRQIQSPAPNQGHDSNSSRFIINQSCHDCSSTFYCSV